MVGEVQQTGIYITTAWLGIALTIVAGVISIWMFVITLMTRNQIRDNLDKLAEDQKKKEDKKEDEYSAFKKTIYSKFDESKNENNLAIKELELNVLELKIHKESTTKQITNMESSMKDMSMKIENLQREVHMSMGAQMDILKQIFEKVQIQENKK